MKALARAAAVVALGWGAAGLGVGHASPARAPGVPVAPPRQQRLEVNDLAMFVGNNGSFAIDQHGWNGGLEYPRGTGRTVGFAAGLWISGRAGGALRMAIAEFGSEWGPGPLAQGAPVSDTTRHQVFRIARGDTAGRAAWGAVAVPLGAPPGLVGDQTLWTACNDLEPAAIYPRGSERMTAPIGLETRATAYAFDRPGTLRRAAFLRLRMIHEGAAPLDSAVVGVFFDPKAVPYALRAGVDTTRDMGYAYPAADPAGGEAAAVGIVWLGGLAPAGPRQRPASFVVYPNGSDPADAAQFDRALRGRFPWGASMVDSSTGQPTPFFSGGDPVTGAGWVATMPPHPHTVLAASPFTFAPGDTYDLDIAIVVGHGADRTASIVDLRAAADEARAAFASGFTNLPAPDPYPAPGRLLAYPNPAPAGARIAFRVEGAVEQVRAIVYDASGRRVRRLLDAPRNAGRHVIEWDGADDDGRRAGAGLYFARVTVGGRAHVARIVRLSGE